MNERSIPFPKFTPQARSRWSEIPANIQKGILETTWCRTCGGAVRIVPTKGKMESRLLILEGTCDKCGNEVVRSVEPKD